MKNILALLLAAVMILSLLAGCGSENAEATAEETQPPVPTAVGETQPRFHGEAVALVTELEAIDDEPLAVACWQAIEHWCAANGMERGIYEPEGDSRDARLVEAARAIADGAGTVVLPGEVFGEVLKTLGDVYPHVNFIAVDLDAPAMDNLACLTFAQEQAGFLAGYAAVKEGYRKLGIPEENSRYISGALQGADAAAQELGVAVEVYRGEFEDWTTIQAVLTDEELRGEDGVLLSALKQPGQALETILSRWSEYGGKTTCLTLTREDWIGLSGDEWLLENFTAEDYEAVKAQIADGSIAVEDTDKIPELTVWVTFPETS